MLYVTNNRIAVILLIPIRSMLIESIAFVIGTK
jgi:hypothetical protein